MPENKDLSLKKTRIFPIGDLAYYQKDVKEFIKRRLERIDLIIKLYPHKSGEELAGQLKEDLMNDAGKELIEVEDARE